MKKKSVVKQTPALTNAEVEQRLKEYTGQLISSQKQYSYLFENMLHGFAYCKTIFIDGVLQDFIYLSVNSEYESMTGLKNIIGMKLSELIPGLLESNPEYVDRLTRVALSGEPEKFETYVDAIGKWLSITLYSPIKEHFVCLLDDITNRKKMEEGLRLSEIRLKEAQSIAHMCHWDVDLVNNTVTWSDQFYIMYGINKAETNESGNPFLAHMHPKDIELAEMKTREAYQSLKDSSYEFRFIRSDGAVRHGSTKWKFEFDENKNPLRIFGILQDITERKAAERSVKLLEKKVQKEKFKAQKKIVRAIIEAQENERNYIGQELHDNINQILASAKLHLLLAEEDKEATQQSVQHSIKLIEKSIEEIRLLCQGMVTPLKNIDLDEMVGELLRIFGQNSMITTDFIYSVPTKIQSWELRLNIYRIIQEQINNILKYASAKNIMVAIRKQGNCIHIIISDDGNGFNVATRRKGIGISNIINRIESLDGKIDIQSSPGNGCVIRISMPL